MSLLSEVKDYLNISYEDEQTERMLKSALLRGQKVIDGYAGAEMDYEEEGLPKQLLFDYCRYVRSQATEMFEKNFGRDLSALREEAEVRNYEN